jgi:hypothetical protein
MKRIAVWLVLVVLAVVLVAPSSFATGSKEEHPSVFKVGFLSSLSGALAGFAETQRKSFIYAALPGVRGKGRGGLDRRNLEPDVRCAQ